MLCIDRLNDGLWTKQVFFYMVGATLHYKTMNKTKKKQLETPKRCFCMVTGNKERK